MKKLQLFSLVALLAVGLAAAPAGAFTFLPGPSEAQFKDYGSLYNATTQTYLNIGSLQYLPQMIANGDQILDLTVFAVTNVNNDPPTYAPPNYYNGSNPQLVGTFYNLEVDSAIIDTTTVSGVTLLTVNLKGVGGDNEGGGTVEVWQNPSNNFDATGGPQAGSGELLGGLYPTVNDAAAQVAGNTQVLEGYLKAPADDGIVLTLNLILSSTNPFLSAGTGTALGYMTLTSGGDLFAPIPLPGDPGDTYQISLYNNFLFYPNQDNSVAGAYGTVYDNNTTSNITFDPTTGDSIGGTSSTLWDTNSHDPLNFTIIPEPATMSLLGMALVGLGGIIRKRRAV